MSRSLRMHVQPALHDAALVASFEGWNDAGEAATTAVQFLAEAIAAVPLADLDCEEFLDLTVRRPTIRLDPRGERRLEWPCTSFRYGAPDAARELVVARGIEPHLQWRRYCDVFAELALRIGVRRVVLLGAYVADVVYSLPVAVTGIATSPLLLEKIGVTPSGYEGPTGIVGALSERFEREGIEVVSLWAGLPHYISAAPNPRGALALLQALALLLDLKLDLEPLRSAAAQFEEKISAIVSADPDLVEYVRQLKRREFAQ
ncbi:MAG: PAC2 family protein [Myxococcales bacterium]|nr:PAC2 family protein [Myxococcales bacterium]MDH5307472.1 PAC2 family protein [Myxococcales bacterium]